ncbi:MAG: hypothetical protein R3B06_07560 [Kofleriaceae bacterium]
MSRRGRWGGAALGLGLAACGAPATPRPSAVASPAAPPGLDQVDWHDRTYELTLLEGEGPMTFPVVHGRYLLDGEPDGHQEELIVGSPVYGDLTGDGVPEAVLELTYRNDGIGPFDRLDVFTGDAAGVRWLGLIHGDDVDGDAAITGCRVVDGALEVARRGRPAERWRFDGRFFVAASRR